MLISDINDTEYSVKVTGILALRNETVHSLCERRHRTCVTSELGIRISMQSGNTASFTSSCNCSCACARTRHELALPPQHNTEQTWRRSSTTRPLQKDIRKARLSFETVRARHNRLVVLTTASGTCSRAHARIARLGPGRGLPGNSGAQRSTKNL